jgi:hypothetical protein
MAAPADAPRQESSDLICLTAQPAIVEGGSATLRAWASTPEGRPDDARQLGWKVSVGRLQSQEGVTQWDLSVVKLSEREMYRKVTATVEATTPGQPALTCHVEVFIGRRDAVPEIERGADGLGLISARHFLLADSEREEEGYGLYSYLLLSAPPKGAEERKRYLKTIEACLLLFQSVDAYLSKHIAPDGLNITYIPLKKAADPATSPEQWAANVLAVYDYAEAQILLRRVGHSHENGPYLVSALTPLSESGASVHLWEDLTGVVPELAWDWTQFFTYLAAQEHSWSDASLYRFGLRLRNLVAVGGKVTPATAAALWQAIQYVRSAPQQRGR